MTPTVSTQILVRGSRLYSPLEDGGMATVITIHGKQDPLAALRSGRRDSAPIGARFDIVFDNGNRYDGVPEALIRGVQWQIHAEIFSEDEIAAVVAKAAGSHGRPYSAQDQERAAYHALTESLRLNPDYAHLKQGTGEGSKLAAINIHRELTRVYPKTTFDVSAIRGDVVLIRWKDGPTRRRVLNLANRHIEGQVDEYENGREHIRNPWAAVFGRTGNVAATRSYSEAFLRRAIDRTFAELGVSVHSIRRPSTAELITGHCWGIEVPGEADNLQELIYKTANAMEG